MNRAISSVSTHENHLKAVGLITVNFALLESTIDSAIHFLIGLDQQISQIITAELSFRGQVALFSSLFRHKTNEAKAVEKLGELTGKATRAEEKRNIITHSLWAEGEFPNEIVRFKRTAKISTGLKNQFEEITFEDLNKIADEIAEVAGYVQEFLISDIVPLLSRNNP